MSENQIGFTITEAQARNLLSNYTVATRGKDVKKNLKPSDDPQFEGWSASARLKFKTLERIGFPLTIPAIKEAAASADVTDGDHHHHHCKRFYDDMYVFLALVVEKYNVVDEAFNALHEQIRQAYFARHAADQQRVRQLSGAQEEAWLDLKDVLLRTHLCLIFSSIKEGSLERSFAHLPTEQVEQLFICAFHILEGLPRRCEELSFLVWSKCSEEDDSEIGGAQWRSNYVADLNTGEVVFNRHKTSGYNPEKPRVFKTQLTVSLPLLRELRSRAADDAKYVLPNTYRTSRRSVMYTRAFRLALGRDITITLLRHIFATGLTEGHYNMRRNADKYIQHYMGHDIKTQVQYYIHHDKIADAAAVAVPHNRRQQQQQQQEWEFEVEEAETEEEATESEDEEEALEATESEESEEEAAESENDASVIDESEPEQQQQAPRRARYIPSAIEVHTLAQLGEKWKPRLAAGERMSIISLLRDTDTMHINGKSAATNLAAFGGEDLSHAERLNKLRNYVRTSAAFQPEQKLEAHKKRVRAAAARQQQHV